MSVKKPLEYQSLKTVLLHLEANIRFQINLHMPSIHKVECHVPLKISYLSINDFVTNINGTSYQLGVYRDYHSKIVARPIRENNEWGGVRHDFDEFGFPVQSGRGVILPGDVEARAHGEEEDENNDEFDDSEEMEMFLRMNVEVREEALRRIDNLKSRGISVNDYIKTLEPIELNLENFKEMRIRNSVQLSRGFLEFLIEEDRANLVPFECRRNGTKPPFTCYIQLTIRKETSKKIERLEYNKKLYEAAKSLNTVLFGSRRFPINVGTFDTMPLAKFYRIPMGFQLKSRILQAFCQVLSHGNLFSIMGQNVKTLYINTSLDNSNAFQNEFVRNSESLIIHTWCYEIRMMPEIIRKLTNRNIYVNFKSFSLNGEECFEIVQGWMDGNREIGAFCHIGFDNEKTARDVLRMVRLRNEKTKRTKRCVLVSINKSTRFEVFYVPFRKTSGSSYYGRNCKWILKMRIVKV